MTKTKAGKEIVKSTFNEGGITTGRRKRSGSANGKLSPSVSENTLDQSNVSFDNNLLMSSKNEKNIFKQQAFNFVKIHKPKKRRDMNKRGKSVVSEIHPSQVEEAAMFMVKTFRSSLFPPTTAANDSTNTTTGQTVSEQNVSTPTDANSSSKPTDEAKRESIASYASTPLPSSPSWHPLLAYIFKTTNVEDVSEDSLFFLCTMLVKYGLKYGRIYVSTYYPVNNEGKEIQAISIWQHPYNSKGMDFWKMLRLGVGKARKSL